MQIIHSCFARCIACFLNPENTEHGNLPQAQWLHSELGFSMDHKVAFSDVCKFEALLNMKILFYHAGFV